MMVVLITFANVLNAQLVTPPFDCSKEGKDLCDKFIEKGGLTCKQYTQTICYHKNQQDNDRDYCDPQANYNCRTFLSRYGYFCNATMCAMSLLH